MTPIIACFPGQGAQQVGMLAELSIEYPSILETFQEASDAAGFDLWQLVSQGPADELNLTYNTQPALLAASIAMWRVVTALYPDLSVVAAAGHSLGEYSALVAANALDFEQAVKLIKKRGELMDKAVPAGQGGMAAILGLEESQIRQICEQVAEAGILEPANFNAPGQVVVAGNMLAINAAIPLFKAAGAKRALPLVVSGPFHSSLMKAAAGEFGEALSDVSWRAPEFTVYHNVDNCPATQSEIPGKLLTQLYNPVNWSGAIQSMRSAGKLAIEFGPGKILAGLNKRIDKTLVTCSTGDLPALSHLDQCLQNQE